MKTTTTNKQKKNTNIHYKKFKKHYMQTKADL